MAMFTLKMVILEVCGFVLNWFWGYGHVDQMDVRCFGSGFAGNCDE